MESCIWLSAAYANLIALPWPCVLLATHPRLLIYPSTLIHTIHCICYGFVTTLRGDGAISRWHRQGISTGQQRDL
jgi:hypothetical protein